MALEDHPKYSRIMAQTDAMITLISNAQETFLNDNGKYFLGEKTLTEATDGTTDKPIKDEVKNAYENFSNALNNIRLPFRMRIYRYGGNVGWTVIFDLVWEGAVWIYRWDEGVEQGPNQGVWYYIPDTESAD